MSQSNRIIRLCNRCIRREKEKYNASIHNQCIEIRLTQWNCPYYFCKIQDRFRIGRHTYPIDIVDYKEELRHGEWEYSGRCFWQKNTPRETQIATLPIHLIEFNPETRTIKNETYTLTESFSGQFRLHSFQLQKEHYMGFKLDDINISVCQKKGVVTGHECQVCFQTVEKSKKKFAHQIRCRKENIIQQHSFEFIETKQLYRSINPIFN